MSDKLIEINEYGTQCWKNSKGQFHRDGDLPAIVYSDGGCEWFKNNNHHRDYDLPAKIYTDGRCEWYQNGRWIKIRQCTPEEVERYKKPYYLQRKQDIQFNRFEKLIK